MFERAFQHLSWWGTVPKPFATGADKLFRAYLGKHKDLATADLPRPTVNYECLWAGAYRHIGETPPPGAKDLAGIDGANWIKNASPWEVAIAELRLGLTLKKPDDLA